MKRSCKLHCSSLMALLANISMLLRQVGLFHFHWAPRQRIEQGGKVPRIRCNELVIDVSLH